MDKIGSSHGSPGCPDLAFSTMAAANILMLSADFDAIVSPIFLCFNLLTDDSCHKYPVDGPDVLFH